MLRKIYALIKKEFLVESSYKVSFLLNIFSVATSLCIYFFIDKLFGYRMVGYLEEFGVSYFSYVLLAMAFFSFIGVGIGSLASRLRNEQLQGTLEALLLTPLSIPTLLVGLVLWSLAFAALDALMYIGCGVVLFHINFSSLNIASACVVLFLTIISFSSLGIISASFVLVLKKGDLAGWFTSQLQGLLGGVYFPVAVMPAWLQLFSKCFPITYAVKAMQLAVYRGFSPLELKEEISALVLFSLLLLPLSLFCFRFALNRARKQGSLSTY